MHRCRLFCHNQGIYPYEYIQVTKHLNLLWLRSLSYRNQSSDLLCKSMNWFLYDWYLHHDSVKTLFTHHIRKSVLICCKAEFAFFVVFFCLGFLSKIFTIHMIAGERGGYLFIYFLPLPLASQPLRHCCRELTLRIAGSRNRIGNLWFPNGSH